MVTSLGLLVVIIPFAQAPLLLLVLLLLTLNVPPLLVLVALQQLVLVVLALETLVDRLLTSPTAHSVLAQVVDVQVQ
jgi:hypothetical protein